MPLTVPEMPIEMLEFESSVQTPAPAEAATSEPDCDPDVAIEKPPLCQRDPPAGEKPNCSKKAFPGKVDIGSTN
ncbi:MAG: hypothetical protein LC732_12025 [Acidobacteria bacterium]|nr:hypothetical protein [Acidobacteriota bacterium]